MANERVETLIGILAGHPGGLDPTALLARLRERWPNLTEGQADHIITAAGEAVRANDGLVFLSEAGAVDEAIEPHAGVRIVSFDCETAVRLTASAPYTEARLFQIGAVRAGTDAEWIEVSPTFERFVLMPEGFEVFDPATRSRYEAEARDPAAVLTELRDYVRDADYLVAYNGEVADFAFIDAACEVAGLERIEGPRRCDSLYLALCIYPQLSVSHTLYDLAARAEIDLEGLTWHDALADSEVQARLLRFLAGALAAMDPGIRAVVATLCVDSPAWRMLFALAGLDTPVPTALDDSAVGAVLERVLSVRAPVRMQPRTTVGAIPADLKGAGGDIDPHLVATAARGAADERPSQQQMANVIRGWIHNDNDGMCEAPTGIGKSYVTLSCALEWLEAHPSGRVVIATHTKQLQRQLASEIEGLARGELAWLRPTAGLVKGARNRLSLRGLVRAVADATDEMSGPPSATGTQPLLWRELRFREVVAFLFVRLCAPTYNLGDEWESRSVDPMDVPLFFDTYTEGSLAHWLGLLSQGESSDYAPPAAPHAAAPPTPGTPGPGYAGTASGNGTIAGDGDSPSPPPQRDPLAAHTEFVPEAVDRHRLVITNHALLMSHLDSVGDPNTLLIVDEAHAIEGAATEALSANVDYLSFELIAREAQRVARDLAAVLDVSGLLSTARGIEDVLASGGLPITTERIFDTILGPATRAAGNRVATLASWWGGDQAYGAVRRAMGHVRRLGADIEHLRSVLTAIMNSPAIVMVSTHDGQRLAALSARADSVAKACETLCVVADEIWGQSPVPPAQPAGGTGLGGGAGGDSDDIDSGDMDAQNAGNGAASADGENADELDGEEETEDPEGEESDAGSEDGGDGDPPPIAAAASALPAPNRIVWAAEQASPDRVRGPRYYRFSLHASPVELAREAEWAGLRGRFARSIWISATLSVAGSFDFIRSRLGFGADVEDYRLPASFRYEDHARLFVLSDFPSWSEHEAQAIRTTAWQVAGFCDEITKEGMPAPGADATAPAPLRGGAMVITTSKAAAAGVADRISADLAGRSARVPVHAAVLRGNQRALSEFTGRGGVLIGTKGLWAGVDISNHETVRLLWVNKLPFSPFADPLIEARRALVAQRAADAGADDPEAVAQREYYLPLAALELRQGIGRLIRGDQHRGVVVISDRRLSGSDQLRRMYREVFLGSLDPGLLVADGDDPYGGNVVTMSEAWDGIWSFMEQLGELPAGRAAELCTPWALRNQTVAPETRAILNLAFSATEAAELRTQDENAFVELAKQRCAEAGGLLNGLDSPLELRDEQLDVIDQVTRGGDCLALLPTGFGKSFCYQLPALVLPGVTVVISPLVALMADQAMTLNRTIGGAVRALVAPLRDSSSRAGKAEVSAALQGTGGEGIKLVYISPERAAQRAFREALYAGVRSGCLARVAIDEAHTLIQWGDDFRPAFRRLEPVLAELRRQADKSGHSLSISALTATANQSVRDGLLRGVFAHPDHPTNPTVPPVTTGPRIVEANPIRPEIAIYTRQLARGGDVAISSLAESVADATPGHLIIYCLTINEVQSTYAQLRAWIGPEREWQVRRFHGRLSVAEKSAVLDSFKNAPSDPHEEGYYRMIIVATAAFGLGVDRSDVAAVLCLSPPADMASLYQQLGRAGRGLAQGSGYTGSPGAVGMALAHRKGWRMVEFLTTVDLSPAVLRDLGKRVLASGGLVDARAIAYQAIAAQVASGAMHADAARQARTQDEYRSGVVRALSALSALGAIVDHGDIPDQVKVTPGPFTPEGDDDRRFVAAVVAAVDTIASPDARGAAKVTCRVVDLHTAVAAAHASEPGDGPAETWVRLYDAHGAGWLDVSQYAPDQRYLSAVVILTATLPAGYEARVTQRRRRALDEIRVMKDWFADTSACAQQGFADYFDAGLPATACATAACRCSRCWFDATKATDPVPEPALFGAFVNHAPRSISGVEDARRTERLRRDISDVLRLRYRGVTTGQLEALFRGKEAQWSTRARRSFRVPGWIPDHALFGSGRGWLRGNKLTTVLDELAADGLIAPDGRHWRLSDYMTAAPSAAQAPVTIP